MAGDPSDPDAGTEDDQTGPGQTAVPKEEWAPTPSSEPDTATAQPGQAAGQNETCCQPGPDIDPVTDEPHPELESPQPTQPQSDSDRPEPDATDIEPGGAEWAALVYARTPKADLWWRAVPAGVEQEDLAPYIFAATERPHELDAGPRFLLVRANSFDLVGIVCRGADLSETMRTDGARPLYAVVGWARVAKTDSRAVPPLADLASQYVDWAGPVYQRWMALDWDKDWHELQSGPNRSQPGRAPWADSAQPEPRRSFTKVNRLLIPMSDAEAVWGQLASDYVRASMGVGWLEPPRNTDLDVVATESVTDQVWEHRPGPSRSEPPLFKAPGRPEQEPQSRRPEVGRSNWESDGPPSPGFQLVETVADQLLRPVRFLFSRGGQEETADSSAPTVRSRRTSYPKPRPSGRNATSDRVGRPSPAESMPPPRRDNSASDFFDEPMTQADEDNDDDGNEERS